jgi:hypothetical protein
MFEILRKTFIIMAMGSIVLGVYCFSDSILVDVSTTYFREEGEPTKQCKECMVSTLRSVSFEIIRTYAFHTLLDSIHRFP